METETSKETIKAHNSLSTTALSPATAKAEHCAAAAAAAVFYPATAPAVSVGAGGATFFTAARSFATTVSAAAMGSTSTVTPSALRGMELTGV